jgi:hypothetical protein
MKSKTHSDNSRLKNWIYSRLWNSLEEGRAKSTTTLIREMAGFFKLNLSPYQLENLKKTISRTRNTVAKRFHRHMRIRETLSKTWRTDVRLIRRWELGGVINLEDHNAIKRLTIILNERDYVAMVVPDEIPADIKTSIWG